MNYILTYVGMYVHKQMSRAISGINICKFLLQVRYYCTFRYHIKRLFHDQKIFRIFSKKNRIEHHTKLRTLRTLHTVLR